VTSTIVASNRSPVVLISASALASEDVRLHGASTNTFNSNINDEHKFWHIFITLVVNYYIDIGSIPSNQYVDLSMQRLYIVLNK